MNRSTNRLQAWGHRLFTLGLLCALIATGLTGAAWAVSGPEVTPEFISHEATQGANGLRACSDFAGAGQTWLELKVDPNADGVYSSGSLTVTISNTSNDKTFDWSSNLGIDAVFVKAGDDGNYLYRYDDPAITTDPGEITSDDGLTTPGSGNGISHISFCYDLEAPPDNPPSDNPPSDNPPGPLVPASAGVTVGSCSFVNAASTTPITATVSPTGSASIVITNAANSFTHTFTESGELSISPGSYSWEAIATEGYAITGVSSGSFSALECAPTATSPTGGTTVAATQVLGEKIVRGAELPRTGEDLPAVPALIVGLSLMLIGVSLKRVPRRWH